MLDLRAASGYLYTVENALEIPTNVMFFPQDASRYTAFDPATGALTRLQLRGPTLTVTLPSGRRVTGKRSPRDERPTRGHRFRWREGPNR